MHLFSCSLVLGLTLAVLPSGAFAQQREGEQMKTLPQAELDVVKVLLAQEKAWNAGDMDSFLHVYKNSPDLFVLSRSVARGYEDLDVTYKRNYPDKATMGTLTFSDLKPHLLDEHFATLVGHFSLERAKNKGGNASGIFSLVLEKTAEGWKIILDHTTS